MSLSSIPTPASLRWLMLPALVALAACSGNKVASKAAQAPEEVLIVSLKAPDARDSRGSYRFLMSEGDRRMSVDEFDAWMKANGIRVAKGKGGGNGG